jgi:flagellar L-ring protein precursor FlgH
MKSVVMRGLSLLAMVHLLWACVGHIKPYERKSRVYEGDEYAPRGTGRNIGSLWSESGVTLFEDHRAAGLGDIITVRIEERSDATRDASTSTKRESESSFGVGAFFGTIARVVAKDPNLKPEELFKSISAAEFGGAGSTKRSGELVGTLPVRIKKVMPNGDFFAEGNKIILINDEETFLYLSGVVRPMDIQPDNSVSSSRLADVELEYTGRGVVSDRQSPGWFSRVLDHVWPF